MAQSNIVFFKNQFDPPAEPAKTLKDMRPEERMEYMRKMSLKAVSDLELMLRVLQAAQNDTPDHQT